MSARLRRAPSWLAGGALLGCALAACGGDEKPDSGPAPGGGDAAPGAPPAWHEPASDEPLLSLSLNDAAELALHRGWPLIVRVSVLHPAAFEPGAAAAAPVRIAAAGAALRVRVANQAGEAQSWPLHPAAPLPAEQSLEPDASADAVFWLDGAETSALADGRYTLVAELGAATSPPAAVTLSPEPAPLPPERAREKRLRLLALLLLRGEQAAAQAEVDALLREDPDDLAALEVSGDLLAAQGRTAEARDAYSRALRAFFQRDPKPTEPPVALLRKRQAVLRDVMVPE
jgi:tetratricopeptide (TPR) repeat protein